MGAFFLKLLLIIAATYCCAVGWMWSRQESYLFQPKHREPLPQFEKYRWDRKINGEQLQGWFLDKGTGTTVIYHGGNAEDLSNHCEVLFEGLDVNALLVNYRGYGQSTGTPGEKEMVADCIAVLDLFCEEKQVPPSSIYLMGRSLGSGIAAQVAAARPEVGGTILVTPYESIAAVAKFQYPWLPIDRMLRHPFLAIDCAPKNMMPALILLAEFDKVIPVEIGRKLGEAWGGPKEILTLPAGHYDINEHPAYFEAINRFIRTR
jgi:pimeloyl-ACP methyl ester carboxylesterase